METPCNNCHGKRDCIPSDIEWVSRAKEVFKSVCDGEYYHNDNAKYQIYLQSTVYDTKTVITRTEIKDIFNRIIEPLPRNSSLRVISECTIQALPQPLLDMVNKSSCFKIEWMDHGRYSVITNDSYTTNIMGGKEILTIARQNKIPPKVVDTCNLNMMDMAYRIWSESLFSTGFTITYTGACFWKSESRVVYATCKMLSVMLSHSSIITVTSMTRSRKISMTL